MSEWNIFLAQIHSHQGVKIHVNYIFFLINELRIILESKIFDLYPPHDFQMDLKGQNLIWESMVKIPFIYQDIL